MHFLNVIILKRYNYTTFGYLDLLLGVSVLLKSGIHDIAVAIFSSVPKARVNLLPHSVQNPSHVWWDARVQAGSLGVQAATVHARRNYAELHHLGCTHHCRTNECAAGVTFATVHAAFASRAQMRRLDFRVYAEHLLTFLVGDARQVGLQQLVGYLLCDGCQQKTKQMLLRSLEICAPIFG